MQLSAERDGKRFIWLQAVMRINDMEDPSVAELFSRLSDLGKTSRYSDKASNAAKAADSLNLVLAHGMFRVGSHTMPEPIRQNIINRSAQLILSAVLCP
jgi:hypothetical protein